MVSGQVQVFRDGLGSRWNTTFTVQKQGFFQARSTKYTGRTSHDHWDLRILHPVLAPMRAGYQTLEVKFFKSASTRDTISKRGYGTNVEPMEYRGTRVTGKVK